MPPELPQRRRAKANRKLVDNPLCDVLSRKPVGLDTDRVGMTGIEGGEQRVFPSANSIRLFKAQVSFRHRVGRLHRDCYRTDGRLPCAIFGAAKHA